MEGEKEGAATSSAASGAQPAPQPHVRRSGEVAGGRLALRASLSGERDSGFLCSQPLEGDGIFQALVSSDLSLFSAAQLPLLPHFGEQQILIGG